jgi:hypothetical protein
MFVSTTDWKNQKVIEYNIEYAKQGKDKEIKKIHTSLTLHEELTYGKIYKRQNNGDFWYINPKETIARYITKEQLELFHRWDKEILLPTEEQFHQLKSIGGLPSHEYSLYPDQIEFPARVITNDNQSHDLCIIHFSKYPPFQTYFKKVLLLSDITQIVASDFSLSHELRLASMKAEEIRMSFYPFMVKTKTGHFLTYNGITQFASTGNIKGEEIVSHVDFDNRRFDKLTDIDLDSITYIIGKWDDRIEDLFLKYRQQIAE